MKQTIAIIAMLFCLHTLYGQVTISFCASIDPNGFCNFNNNKFFFSPDSLTQRILMEVNDAKTFTGTTKIIFKIFTVEKNGDEVYSSMTEQNVQDDWRFAWFPHIFRAAGKYTVKVFDDKDQLMCKKSLELFAQK